jgi:hypothetical protein
MKIAWFFPTLIAVMSVSIAAQSADPSYVYNNFAPNVRQSFAWGITDNLGLSREDLEGMGAVILNRNQNIELAKASQDVKLLSETALKELCTHSFLIDFAEIDESEFTKPNEEGKAYTGYIYHEKSELKSKEASSSPLSFLRQGKRFFRQFIHPLRSNREFLEKLGNPVVHRGRFLAMFTESRSIVILDRVTGEFWSIKLSLPAGPGIFTDKAFGGREARIQLRGSEWLLSLVEDKVLTDELFLPEIEAVGFSVVSTGLAEGQLVRSLKILESENYLLPYTAVYSNGLGKYIKGDIAVQEKKWLSDEPARAAAQLFVKAGALLNSNHAQNSTLLLNANRQPLKLYLRDHDLDLNTENALAALASKHIGTKNKVIGGTIDFSMMNGFQANSNTHYKGPQYKVIVSNFAQTVISEIYKLQGRGESKSPGYSYLGYTVGRESATHINGWDKRFAIETHGHYGIETNSMEQAEKNWVAMLEWNSKTLPQKYEKVKEAQYLPDEPDKFFKELLLRKDQPLGYGSNLIRHVYGLNLIQVKEAWHKLQKEFYLKGDKSTIGQVLGSEIQALPWNLYITSGILVTPKDEDFLGNLIDEAIERGYPHLIKFLFLGSLEPHKRKESPDSAPEVLGAMHRRLLKRYIEKASTTAVQLTILNEFYELDLPNQNNETQLFFNKLTPEMQKIVHDKIAEETKSGKAFWMLKKQEHLLPKLSPQFNCELQLKQAG